MKKLTLLVLLMTLVVTAFAVPAKRGVWKTLKLSDGTEVKAQLTGDEFGHCWQDGNGKAYLEVPDKEDCFEAVDIDRLNSKNNERRVRANGARAMRLSQQKMIRTEPGSYFGMKKGLILLVNFKDKQFKTTHNQAFYQRIANEEGYTTTYFRGSISDYFKSQSFGKFELDFDVYGPFDMQYERSHYGDNDSQGNDKHPGEMVIEAVKQAKEFIEDWTQYDWDGDGKVDQVYIIYADKGAADTGIASTIWPHAYTLTDALHELHDGTGPETVGENLVVDTYACGPELNASGRADGIGTMCHEFSHCLGFPDFYDTSYSGGQGMSNWDLMDSGCYNGNGYVPAGYTSYERWMAGWLEPIVLEDEDVSVTGMESLQEGGQSYVIYNKRNRNEYFLLENRQLNGWDAGLPGSGLLILHVDFNGYAWTNNTPNNNPKHQRMTWMAADDEYQYEMYDGTKYYTEEGMANDPYPYKKNKSFNKASKPAAKLFNRNSDNSYFLSSSVENIAVNAAGRVSFDFFATYVDHSGQEGGDDDPPVIVSPDPTGAIFYESFDGCNGKGGNDGKWNGLIGSSKFQADNEGWTSEKAYGASQCAKFGTNTIGGKVTTPKINLEGKCRLYFKAGAWNYEDEGTTLYLSAEGANLNRSSVTLEIGEFKTYEVILTAKHDSPVSEVYITFECPDGRFFLDEVIIKANNIATGLEDAVRQNDNWQTADDTPRYNLNGQRVGQAYKGFVIIDGKKYVRH